MVAIQLQKSDKQSDIQASKFIYIQTFGCQMNVNDTDRIFQVMRPHGWAPTDDPARASLILLNTCSVRDKAEQKMLSLLGRLAPLKENNDQLILGVAGCVAQQEGEALLKKVPYLDLVFGPDHIGTLPDMIARIHQEGERVAETEFFRRKDFRFVEAQPPEDTRVSEFVTIMKGCDKVCSYCIVPFTRGREVSKSQEMIVREIERLVAAGAKEITLLGQNVNSYGRDLQTEGALRSRKPTFAALLETVDAIEGLERLRFTTSHPMDAIDDLVEQFGKLPSLCEYFHLPVQAGNDRVLQAMRRFYTVDSYREKVAALRKQSPDMTLSTDIIVGFPGETDEEFEDTLNLLAEIEYDFIYAFMYSERPGTRASKMGDTVPLEVKKARLKRVLDQQVKITERKMAALVGQTLEVLIEGPSQRTSRGGTHRFQMMGRTRTNWVVNIPVPFGDFWERRWAGELAQVEILEVRGNTFLGQFA